MFLSNCRQQCIIPACLTVILIYIRIYILLTSESVPSCFFELNHCDWKPIINDHWRMSRLKRPVDKYTYGLFRKLGKSVHAYLPGVYLSNALHCTYLHNAYIHDSFGKVGGIKRLMTASADVEQLNVLQLQ